ncbi:hypothetical protein JKP88DRAFT_243775 [Tribonema minus]|uniref:Uncharacterized protein n=1 Tax=Tribonema minus TaxID=303371 RepID=A0A836CHY8_9STRA|nr:hypothetical protein JKP88DRAFT_243775 [Tribonema minus]
MRTGNGNNAPWSMAPPYSLHADNNRRGGRGGRGGFGSRDGGQWRMPEGGGEQGQGGFGWQQQRSGGGSFDGFGAGGGGPPGAERGGYALGPGVAAPNARRPYSPPPPRRGFMGGSGGDRSPDLWQHDKWEMNERERTPSPQPGFISLRFLRKLQSEASFSSGGRPHAEETASTIASTDVHPPSSIGHESGHETGAEEGVSLLGLSNPCSPSHSHASESEGPVMYSEPLTSPARSLLSG